MRAFIKNVQYSLRTTVGRTRWSLPLLSAAPSFRRRLVQPATDLCIEGFPRSANTFMLHAFQTWNPDERIAHHLHVPGHVLRASRLGVPVLLLVRPPMDALASVLVVDDALRADIAVASYVDFHQRAWSVRNDVVIASFETATQRPDVAIQRVNRRFGTSFKYDSVDGAFIDDVMSRVVTSNDGQPETLLAAPSDLKAARKAEARRRVEGVPDLRLAQSWYDRYRQREDA